MTLALVWAAVSGFAKDVFKLLPLRYWLAIAAVGAVLGYHFYAVHAARSAGFTEGFAEANEQCDAREKTAQEAAEKRQKELEQEKQDAEARQATELALAGANYEKELQDAEDQRRRDVAAAHAGAIKLRVAGMCPANDRSAAAETAAAPGVSHGATTGELPSAITGDLLQLADTADDVARQLGACQALVKTYTKGKT